MSASLNGITRAVISSRRTYSKFKILQNYYRWLIWNIPQIPRGGIEQIVLDYVLDMCVAEMKANSIYAFRVCTVFMFEVKDMRGHHHEHVDFITAQQIQNDCPVHILLAKENIHTLDTNWLFRTPSLVHTKELLHTRSRQMHCLQRAIHDVKPSLLYVGSMQINVDHLQFKGVPTSPTACLHFHCDKLRLFRALGMQQYLDTFQA